MVSAIVWSENVDIKYVNELLLIDPNLEDHKKLTSIITILYNYKNKEIDDFDLNLLQRGLIGLPRILFPNTNQELKKRNGLYNKLISLATEKENTDERKTISFSNSITKEKKEIGYEGRFSGSKIGRFYFENINKIYKDKTTLDWEGKLKDQIPFSIIHIKGNRDIHGTNKMGMARVAFEIKSELDEKYSIDGCPHFENLRYKVMSPARVYDHLVDEEIERRISNASFLKINEPKELIEKFKEDIYSVQDHCGFLQSSSNENKRDYKFELTIAINGDDYFCLPGNCSDFKIKALTSYKDNDSGHKYIPIRALLNNLSDDDGFILSLEKKAKGACSEIEKLTKKVNRFEKRFETFSKLEKFLQDNCQQYKN